jgi:hypothetical protein
LILTLTTAGGVGLGAGIMYLLDPVRGRRRRAVARGKLVHLFKLTADALDVGGRDLAHRSSGVAARIRAGVSSRPVSDYVLVERVRSRMGRHVSHPHAIEVKAKGGRVVLKGPVLEGELNDLLACVWAVPGVSEIDNRLESYREPGDVPGLQGGSSRLGARSELGHEKWAPAMRLVATLSGVAFALWGSKRGGVRGGLLVLLGLAAVGRGVTNVPVRRLLAAGGPRAIDVRETEERTNAHGREVELTSIREGSRSPESFTGRAHRQRRESHGP